MMHWIMGFWSVREQVFKQNEIESLHKEKQASFIEITGKFQVIIAAKLCIGAKNGRQIKLKISLICIQNSIELANQFTQSFEKL